MILPIDTILRILQVVLGFTLLLLFHEMGHLIGGVLVGVKVERLSLGFGPKLFGFKRGGTEYIISAVPAGGYVKFKGDEPGSPESREPDSFWGKPPGPRALIIIGGVFMNLVTAVIAFAIAFGIGVRTESPVVGEVIAGSPADIAGFEPGDRILAIGGTKVAEFIDLTYGVAFGSRGKPLEVEAQRDGEIVSLRVVPEFDEDMGIQTIGIIPPLSLTVAALMRGSAARDAGIRAGDRILSLDGVEMRSWEEFEGVIKDRPGKTVNITVMRGDDMTDIAALVEEVFEWTLGAEGFPLVQSIRPGWPAEKAGLLKGDVLLAFNDSEIVSDSLLLLQELLDENGGRPVRFTLLRGDQRLQLTVTPTREKERWLLGIAYSLSTLIAGVHQDSPAADVGIIPGDRIVSAAGAKVTTLNEVKAVLGERKDSPTTLQWLRGEELMTAEIIARKADTPPVGFLGVIPEPQTEMIRLGLVGASRLGVLRSISTLRKAWRTVVALVTRRVSPTNIGGPVLIGRVLYHRAGQGLGKLIYFFGMISVFIALPNMLPLPILDGGHLVIVLIEKLKGSPVSTRAMMVWQYAGIVLIGAIFILVLANDIHRLATSPF
jgi:regulator of sigma E protease